MTDPGLKLPLKIIGGIGNHTRMVTDTTGRILVDIRGEATRAQHRAEVICAALTADANLGDPPCDCIEKKDGCWRAWCQCGNPDDRAVAAAWCAEANILCRKSDAEKEVQGG